MQELERNKLEVELFENKLDMIKSIHKECDENINWTYVERLNPPFKLDKGEKGKNELDAIDKFNVNTETVVTKETKSLTKTGKVSTKQMTKTKYYDIQQDYICSCTLRIARDMFALLPIDYIVINALDDRLDTSTVCNKKEVVLSVKIDKYKLSKLNMDLIDPSDSMSNFQCNMKFKKTGGLSPVERIIK